MTTTSYVFTPEPQVSLPVAGRNARFPVGRVFCVGRNYPWPGASSEKPDAPVFFMKPASAVVEAVGEVIFPPMTDEFCHEIEFVVAIGKAGTSIAQAEALEHVWGYAAGLDLTRRDIQMRVKSAGMAWEMAKVFEGAAPISAVVPVAKAGHPEQGAVWLSVNGRERQRSTLQEQIFSVSEVISLLSGLVPLRPGDLIMTGTPHGVAALNPGDVINAGIGGVAELEMRVGNRP
ncbi:fumarylacetoacetate hydrolase family protein [Pseudomonas sp. WHRI 8822A]|uniref:fumarylacetoacetate hydrolase family protein n=1 Tax=Pseudomonas sp. WHRI 8822A TaxID=3162568 RepID=UPI0032EFD436